jgi:hypothetical protein
MANIYGLYDANGTLRYIGKANCPKKRLSSHMTEARSTRRSTPLYAWLRKNGAPEMRILEVECADWAEAERRLIAQARSRGDNLLNVADGGDEPHCPIEVRRANAVRMNEKLSAADPVTRKLRHFKKTITIALNKGEVADKTRAKLRLLSTMRPDIFACWKDLPDIGRSLHGAA